MAQFHLNLTKKNTKCWLELLNKITELIQESTMNNKHVTPPLAKPYEIFSVMLLL